MTTSVGSLFYKLYYPYLYFFTKISFSNQENEPTRGDANRGQYIFSFIIYIINENIYLHDYFNCYMLQYTF